MALKSTGLPLVSLAIWILRWNNMMTSGGKMASESPSLAFIIFSSILLSKFRGCTLFFLHRFGKACQNCWGKEMPPVRYQSRVKFTYFPQNCGLLGASQTLFCLFCPSIAFWQQRNKDLFGKVPFGPCKIIFACMKSLNNVSISKIWKTAFSTQLAKKPLYCSFL